MLLACRLRGWLAEIAVTEGGWAPVFCAGEEPDAGAGAAIQGAARRREVQGHGAKVRAHGRGASQL